MIRSITVAALYLCALSVEVLPAQSAATPKAVTVIAQKRWPERYALERPFRNQASGNFYPCVPQGFLDRHQWLDGRRLSLCSMSREASEVDLRPFRFVYGYLPTDILVGHCGCTGAGREHPQPFTSTGEILFAGSRHSR